MISESCSQVHMYGIQLTSKFTTRVIFLCVLFEALIKTRVPHTSWHTFCGQLALLVSDTLPERAPSNISDFKVTHSNTGVHRYSHHSNLNAMLDTSTSNLLHAYK